MNKYIKFNSEYPHYQVAKFNGTKGILIMKTDNVGIYDEQKGTYVFEEVNGVVPEIIATLVESLEKCGKTQSFVGFHKSGYYDDDHKDHVVRFEKRVFMAKTQIDLDWAWLAFCATEADRLSIKLSLMELNKQSI